LQGIMGGYYARHDGLGEAVAHAIEDHYKPRFAGDELPRNHVGLVVALADKLETLVGIWGIGLQPTGEKDPFALRRHALGILRMLIEKPLTLITNDALQIAAASFDGIAAVKPDLAAITDFLYDRLRGYLKDKGYSTNEVEAVVSQRPQRLDDIVARLEAVRAFAALPQAEALAAANKRITNILKKTEVAIGAVQSQLLKEDAERALAEAVTAAIDDTGASLHQKDYVAVLARLARLRPQVDAFFDGVMVNAEDPALRGNRLALLTMLGERLGKVAAIEHLSS